MTECHRLRDLENTLERARAHIALEKCTDCATAILDVIPPVIETIHQVVIDAEHARSELEADKLRTYKKLDTITGHEAQALESGERRAPPDNNQPKDLEPMTDELGYTIHTQTDRPPSTDKALGKLRDPHSPSDGGF